VNLAGLDHPLTYLGIMIAAVVEGEIAFVAAAALVGRGYLNPIAVVIAGALGATIGDQFYFYVLRGRLQRWVDRYDAVARRGQMLARHVRRHETPMVLLIRFAPGLRIALAAACAYAGVAPLRFSVLNSLSSLVWAMSLLALVAWVGPNALPKLGLSGWWTILIPAMLIVLLFRVAGRVERHVLVDGAPTIDSSGH
jgi:membrane protein DedA with SNARE-associated domain